MKTPLTVALLYFFICSAQAATDLQTLSWAMTAFGENPSKEAFEKVEAMAESSSKELDKKTNAAPFLVSVFEYRTAQKYGWKIKGTSVVARVAKELLKGRSPQTPYINDDSSVDPTKLDIWWVSYAGTGDEVYLKKILVYAGEDLPKRDLPRSLIVGAATWSFLSNCKQHENVRQFAQRCLSDDAYISKQKFLRKCVDG